MSKWTKEKYKEFLAGEDDIYSTVLPLARAHAELRGLTGDDAAVGGTMTLYDDKIKFEWEFNWAYGGHSDHCYTVPASLLWDDQWKEKLLAELEEKRKAEAAQAEERRAKEAAERAELERLNTKYGTNP